MEYHRNRPTMRPAEALLITAIFCFSALPQASHSLPAVLPRGEYSTHRALLINNVGSLHRQVGGTSTTETQPSRRALLHAKPQHRGVKVEMRRIETLCGMQKTGDSSQSDHQRLRCAVQRSSLRAQEVRKGPRVHSGAGSKVGDAAGNETIIIPLHACSHFQHCATSLISFIKDATHVGVPKLNAMVRSPCS